MERLLAEVLTEVRALKVQTAELVQTKYQNESGKLLFDFSKIEKREVMMHFVELYERYGIFGTKNQLQQFLAEQTNLGTKASVDRLYNRCLRERLRK